MFCSTFNLTRHLQHVEHVCRDVLTYSASATRKYGFGREQSGNLDAPSWARYALPYCVESLDPDGLLMIVLNRDYKPVGLGIPYGLYVDYAQFDAWTLQGEQALRINAADCWTHSHGPNHWLFDDGDQPWSGRVALRRYLSRLSALCDVLAAPAAPLLLDDCRPFTLPAALPRGAGDPRRLPPPAGRNA